MAIATSEAAGSNEDTAKEPASGGGRKKLLLLGVPLLLAALGGGLWFTGILPKLLGMKSGDPASADATARGAAPVFIEVPEIIANLNTGTRRVSFVKLKARLELARAEDAARVQAAMPRILDLFQTYIREMRPEELRGSAGTYRLREELISRAELAVQPAHVRDVLFIEMLVQ